MALNDEQKRVVFSFLKFLTKQEHDKQKEIGVAVDLLCDTFGIELNNPSIREKFELEESFQTIFQAGAKELKATTLENLKKKLENHPLFENFVKNANDRGYFRGTEPGTPEYFERYSKLLIKFDANVFKKQKIENEEKNSEQLKILGNESLQKKDYPSAIRFYSRAIEISPSGPNSHLYYSNRAAVLTITGDYEGVISDCNAAIALKPDFVKAYLRLGSAYFNLNKFTESKEVYQKVLTLEPNNETAKEFISKSEANLNKNKNERDVIAELAQSFKAGEGLENILQNTALTEMAEQMIQNNSELIETLKNNITGQQSNTSQISTPEHLTTIDAESIRKLRTYYTSESKSEEQSSVGSLVNEIETKGIESVVRLSLYSEEIETLEDVSEQQQNILIGFENLQTNHNQASK